MSLKIALIITLVLAGCQPQIDPREQKPDWPPPDPQSPLVGTGWANPDWGGRKLHFETAELVFYTRVYTDVSSYKNYFYDKEKRIGEVETLGPFTVTQNYQRMTFSNIEGYGHHMDFTRD